MSVKKKLTFCSFLFFFLVAGVGSVLFRNVRREETLFRSVSRVIQARQTLKEMDYFLRRYDRVLLSHVLLPDDAEKYHIYQEQQALAERLDLWGKWVKQGEGSGVDLTAVRRECADMAFLRFQILNLVEKGMHAEAIEKTRQVFLPVSSKIGDELRAAAAALDARNRALVDDFSAVVGLSRGVLVGGIFLGLLLLAVLVRLLRDAMILRVAPSPNAPMKPEGTLKPRVLSSI